MDGGGSTEMVVKNDAGKFVTMNDPCNVKNGKRGYSRAIGDIIAIVIPK